MTSSLEFFLGKVERQRGQVFFCLLFKHVASSMDFEHSVCMPCPQQVKRMKLEASRGRRSMQMQQSKSSLCECFVAMEETGLKMILEIEKCDESFCERCVQPVCGKL